MAVLLNEFEILEKIGEGSYGSCHKVRRKKDNKIFVCKKIFYGNMSEIEKQFIINEVNVLRDLRHAHIVQYVDHVIDKIETTIFLVMEYCPGGDLSECIKKWKRERRNPNEDLVCKIISQVCEALSVCHKNQIRNGASILHRDIKPANIFLDNNMNAKLGDFGLAKVLELGGMTKTFVGTPYYMSPEQLYHQSYDEKSDIWSLGCLAYELCSLRPPFLAQNQTQLAEVVRKGVFKRIPDCYSNKLHATIKAMLQISKNDRPSARDLLHRPELRRFSGGGKNSVNDNAAIKCEKSVIEFKQWEKQLKEKEEELFKREMKIIDKERSLERLKLQIEEESHKARSLLKRSEMDRKSRCSCRAAVGLTPALHPPNKKLLEHVKGSNEILQRSPRLRRLFSAHKSP